jgi:hypothetical protein
MQRRYNSNHYSNNSSITPLQGIGLGVVLIILFIFALPFTLVASNDLDLSNTNADFTDGVASASDTTQNYGSASLCMNQDVFVKVKTVSLASPKSVYYVSARESNNDGWSYVVLHYEDGSTYQSPTIFLSFSSTGSYVLESTTKKVSSIDVFQKAKWSSFCALIDITVKYYGFQLQTNDVSDSQCNRVAASFTGDGMAEYSIDGGETWFDVSSSETSISASDDVRFRYTLDSGSSTMSELDYTCRYQNVLSLTDGAGDSVINDVVVNHPVEGSTPRFDLMQRIFSVYQRIVSFFRGLSL